MPNLGALSSEQMESRDTHGIFAERVRTAMTERSNGTPRIVQVRVPVSGNVRPIDWVRSQDASEQVYWAPRRFSVSSDGGSCSNGGPESDDPSGRTVAGVGAADVLERSARPSGTNQLQRELTDRFACANEHIRYYGGVRFDASHQSGRETADNRWTSFGTYRFVLPRFELWRTEDALTLACNLVLPRDGTRKEAILDSIDQLSFPETSDTASLPPLRGRTNCPEKEGWTRMVNWALDAISTSRLDKVVLAREVALDLGAPVNPFHLLQRLQEATPGCFHFAFSPREAGTFLGASPERLFRCRGGRVITEAVAGTGERGETPEEDAMHRENLLNSTKERREHEFVEDAIRSILEDLCTSVRVPEQPSDFVLARGRHLYSRLSGRLDADRSPVDVLRRLHPTPAVGGVPTTAALKAISQQEPFDRGWYGGPVGWIGPEQGEFAVAIRSGTVQDAQLTLYSGAGIVEGSEPEQEWNEIEQKIGDFAAVMGLASCCA